MKRRLAVMMAICLGMAVLGACGKGETGPGKKDPAKANQSGQEGEDLKTDAEGDLWEDWRTAYLSWLDTLEGGDLCTYSLIYVDEDDIPELLADRGAEAGGCVIVSFQEGVLEEWQSMRLNVSYIEKGNLICNSDGNMGHYYDNVFTIEDGKWRQVASGEWGYGSDEPQFDENGESVYAYQWQGSEVTQGEYLQRLDQVYPEEKRRYPEKYYISEEIRSVLETGDVTSADHRYELIVEDLTWEEAASACGEKGGYLATITSWEEMERIQKQIFSENKENITFFVGANNKEADSGVWYHWIQPGREAAFYDMLRYFNALSDGFWLEGEPSYTGKTESGGEVEEDYVALFCRKAEGRCYLNDVPNDILSAAPSYSGRVGYICEVDLR